MATWLHAGLYVVRLKDSTGCTVFSTVAIGYQHARPDVNLGPDTSVCASSNFSLNAGAGFASYLWSDGSAGQTLAVTSTGTYHVTVTDVNGCQNEDGVHVTVQNCMVIGGNHDGARVASAAQGMTAMVYPNPAHDVVNVAITGIKSEITVKLDMNDILGNRVYSQSSKADSNYLSSI